MPYCNKCGNQLSEDSVFCNKCGNKLTKESVEDIKQETNPKSDKWKKAWDITKKVGKVVGDRAQIIAENLEKDRKEGKGIFAEPSWVPPADINPFDIDIPRGITLDSYSDESIFGTKKHPNKRPHINKALRVLIYRRDNGKCKICKRKVDPFNYHIAHDLAHSKGGLPTKKNLFLACPICNGSMGTKSLKEMKKIMK